MLQLSLPVRLLLIVPTILLAAAACAPVAIVPPPQVTPTVTPRPSPAPSATGGAPSPSSELQPEDDRSSYAAGLIPAEQGVLARFPGASTYAIDLRIADDLGSVTGRQEVRYTNQETVPLAEICLRLFPNATGGQMTTSNGAVDGQAVAARLDSADTTLRVPLPSALPPGGRITIALDYVISVPTTLDVGYGLLSFVDGVLALDSPYAPIPVYDDAGWHSATPPDNADLSYFDVSFYRVRVTAPADLMLVATGVEAERKQEGATQTVSYAAGPARDFFLAASRDYEMVSAQVGDTRINSYARKEWAAGAKHALDTASGALKYYSARFGPYPYTELDVVSTPLLALGIEYPGITGITLRLYDPAAQVAGLPSTVMIESTVAHEVAHQWFYNLVGNDQVAEPWLDEALAQYATGLYYQDAYGAPAAERYRESWEQRWARVEGAEIPIGLPADKYVGQEYSAIIYGRGPFFLAALADRMGQPTIDRFLAAYTARYRWDIAHRIDFETLAEQACGCSLDDLFAAWVDRR